MHLDMYACIDEHQSPNLNLFHFSYFVQTKSIHLNYITLFISNCPFMMFASIIYLLLILICSFYLTRLVETHRGIKRIKRNVHTIAINIFLTLSRVHHLECFHQKIPSYMFFFFRINNNKLCLKNST